MVLAQRLGEEVADSEPEQSELIMNWASFEPWHGETTASTEVYLWRAAEHVGDPADTQEVGRVECVSLLA